ncbi:MAG: hypothetical protein AAGC70_04160 [Pseudomonadota bacterium]
MSSGLSYTVMIVVVFLSISVPMRLAFLRWNLRAAGHTFDDIPGGKWAGINLIVAQDIVLAIAVVVFLVVDPIWEANSDMSAWVRIPTFMFGAIVFAQVALFALRRMFPQLQETEAFLKSLLPANRKSD